MTLSAVAVLVRDDARLSAAAKAAGVPGDAQGECTVESLPCLLTNMTTEDLARVRFDVLPRVPSVIVKIARSPRHSPLWEQIPPALRDQAMEDLPWRSEPDLYRSRLASLLPVGMRMPTVYAIDELEDDRIALWMEDVEERPGAWSRDDYRTAARSLGRLSGKLSGSRIPTDVPVQRRDLRNYFFGRVMHGLLPSLRADATWSHPLVADVVDSELRQDLEVVAASTPDLLDRLAALPHTFAHGDACPQNLLRPAEERGTVVAIDWTFAGVCPVGMDAGQLLAGHAESGELDPSQLEGLFEDIMAGYVAGLADEGSPISAADARFGAIGNLVVRSLFTALPMELIDAAYAEVAELFARRARYARFLVTLADEVLATR